MAERKFVTFEDLGGVLAAELESYRNEWQAKNPDLRVTISDCARIAIREGLNSLRARKPRLQDKQTRGGLKK